MPVIYNKPIGITDKYYSYEKGKYLELFTVKISKSDVDIPNFITVKTVYNFYSNQHFGAATLLIANSDTIECILASKSNFGGSYNFYQFYDEGSKTLHVYVKTTGGNGFGNHYVYKEYISSDDTVEIKFAGGLLSSLPEQATPIE